MKDAAEFLKNEYGTGGASPGIPGAYESDASHDAKGLKLAKRKDWQSRSRNSVKME